MHPMTLGSLQSAYGGESMAHMRYIAWADAAQQEGFPNVAKLFRAISFAEQVHATNHFVAMKDCCGGTSVTAGAGFGLAGTSKNLQGAIEGENHEVEEMYPAFMAIARMQNEKEAIKSFHYAISAEKTHAELYGQAKQAVDAGKDATFSSVYVCKVCGHTVTGSAPDKCPVCARGKSDFVAF
jgi:rubrerythrin